MSVMNNSKSNLGKLLASENIRIEHRKVRGPFFDVKERILVLPVWKEMSNNLYDLMIGHEVGHALFTPSEGWLDKVKENPGFKTFINIVEDVRIERKMKERYPGLVKPMYEGYTELVNRDFFGCTLADMNTLPFVDRLNCHFKLGVRAGITFNAEEQSLVDRITNVDSWKDVMSLAQELYDVSEGERQDMEDAFDDMMDESMSDMSDSDWSDMMDDMEQQLEDAPPQSSGSKNSRGQHSMRDAINKLRSKGKGDLADRMEKLSERMQEKIQDWANQETASSMTDDALNSSQEKLIDENAYPALYLKWPKLNVKDYVIPYKQVYDNMEFSQHLEGKKNDLYQEYMNINKNYISYLVKEFELRRNAKQFARAQVSKTGSLDMDRIWQYKLSEDLFLQSTVVPDGKNHGMLMVMDMSSSMTDNMKGTVEQTIALAMFCRRVNIPFRVFGFIDNSYAHEEFSQAGIDFENRNDTTYHAVKINDSCFRLKEFFSNKMTLTEFNDAVKKMLMYAETFKYTRGWYSSYETEPRSMQLGGTPLNETVLVLRYIAEQFRKDTRVEILNTVILTDGEASYGLDYVRPDDEREEGRWGRSVVVEDQDSPKAVRMRSYGNNITSSLLELYREITGSRVIGLYISSGRNHKATIQSRFRNDESFNYQDFENAYKKQFLKHRYIGMPVMGYDMSYVVPGDELEIEDVDLDIVIKSAKAKTEKTALLKAFKKVQNSKQISRVFLNQFIQHVA